MWLKADWQKTLHKNTAVVFHCLRDNRKDNNLMDTSVNVSPMGLHQDYILYAKRWHSVHLLFLLQTANSHSHLLYCLRDLSARNKSKKLIQPLQSNTFQNKENDVVQLEGEKIEKSMLQSTASALREPTRILDFWCCTIHQQTFSCNRRMTPLSKIISLLHEKVCRWIVQKTISNHNLHLTLVVC